MQKRKWGLILLIFVGTFLQGLTMFRSGLPYSFGLGFWGPNGHDGIWHLALINQVLKGFPPPHPSFAGELLTNYHYFFDLLLGIVGKVTFIPVINLYFQVFPVMMAFLLGLLSFLVGYKITKNFWVGFWFAFMNYFAGSFGYLVTLIRDGSIGGESLFWSMQSISAQINPPYALSLVMILFSIWLLLSLKNIKKKEVFLLSVIFGILINVKIYAGIIILPSLLVYSLIKYKEDKNLIKIFIGSSIISGIIFLLTNRNSGNLLIFEPFWFIHSMVESQDRLYIPKLALARYTLLAGGGYKRLILVELAGIAFFLAGNLGTRMLGAFSLLEKIKKRKFEKIEIFFLVGGLISLVIPLLLVQKGTAWNTIQFFYYFLFFFNFYTAIFLSRIIILKNKYIASLLVVTFVLLTVPTTYSSLKNYTGLIPPAVLPKNEVKALDFLKDLPDGRVLTYPYSPYLKRDLKLLAPVPLYAYETSAYVSAFTGKQTYLEDEMNLDISGYNWQERRKEVEKYLINEEDIFKARGLLVNNKIRYLYLANGQSFKFKGKDWEMELIYDKDNVHIYRVIW